MPHAKFVKDAVVQPFIVATTANASEEDQRLCIESGMNLHLAKPIRLLDLEGLLQRVVLQKSAELDTGNESAPRV